MNTTDHIKQRLDTLHDQDAVNISIALQKLRKASRVSDGATFEQLLEARQRSADALNELQRIESEIFVRLFARIEQ